MKPAISYSPDTKTLNIWMSDRLQTIKEVSPDEFPILASFLRNIYIEGHNDCFETMDDSHGY